jgi:peroxisomal 2,4-dienoyl-CoA reductase
VQNGRKKTKPNTGNFLDGKVAFVTGGNGTICSMQTRALVRLGANACIIGRNVEKTEKAAKDIASVRPGAKVIGIGACDVRNVSKSLCTRCC